MLIGDLVGTLSNRGNNAPKDKTNKLWCFSSISYSKISKER